SRNKAPMNGQHGRASRSTRLKTRTSVYAAIVYVGPLPSDWSARAMVADAPAQSSVMRNKSSELTTPRTAAAVQAWARVAPPASAANTAATATPAYEHRGHQRDRINWAPPPCAS